MARGCGGDAARAVRGCVYVASSMSCRSQSSAFTPMPAPLRDERGRARSSLPASAATTCFCSWIRPSDVDDGRSTKADER